MELTKEQTAEMLRSYKTIMDDDNIRIKEICKRVLIDDPLILYLLNNKELEEADAAPEDYIGKNILSSFIITPTQHDVQNFICLGTDSTEDVEDNDALKFQRISFYILCEEKNLTDKLSGLPRHDLIAARIKHNFNYTNLFGTQCVLAEERETITDSDYVTRLLVFIMMTPKNLVKTENGQTRIINKIG